MGKILPDFEQGDEEFLLEFEKTLDDFVLEFDLLRNRFNAFLDGLIDKKSDKG